MKNGFRWFWGMLLTGQLCAADSVLYENNFEKAEVGKVPADFLVLDGGFAVKDEAGNKVLELPGAPLDSFAAQFGPAGNADGEVTARIYGTQKGRRMPTFGVGLNGVAGYKLQVSPSKNLIELLKDQEVKVTAPFDWQSGKWTHLRLQVRKSGDGWTIEGKTWSEKTPEPQTWALKTQEAQEPPSGKASVFGSPFSGNPILFDDLMVLRPQPKE
jgi:hypothetical protein